MKVAHPFQIPSEIDSQVAGAASIATSLVKLQVLLRRLLVFDGYADAFWALVAISLGFVLICELIGTCLLAHRAAVGRMAIIERHIVFGRKLPLPTSFVMRFVFIALAGLLWCLFCIQTIVLNHEMKREALQHSMVWLGLVWIPVWFTTYLYMLESLQPFVAGPHLDKTSTVKNVLFRMATVCIPPCVFLATALPTGRAQQSLNSFATRFILFHNMMTDTLKEYVSTELKAVDSADLRSYESATISMWKYTADAYKLLQTTYIFWSLFFAGLLMAHLAVVWLGWKRGRVHIDLEPVAHPRLPLKRQPSISEVTLVEGKVPPKRGSSLQALFTGPPTEHRTSQSQAVRNLCDAFNTLLLLAAFVATTYTAVCLYRAASMASVNTLFEGIFATFAVLVPISGGLTVVELIMWPQKKQQHASPIP